MLYPANKCQKLIEVEWDSLFFNFMRQHQNNNSWYFLLANPNFKIEWLEKFPKHLWKQKWWLQIYYSPYTKVGKRVINKKYDSLYNI